MQLHGTCFQLEGLPCRGNPRETKVYKAIQDLGCMSYDAYPYPKPETLNPMNESYGHVPRSTINLRTFPKCKTCMLSFMMPL